jgi:hypothetical protein
VNAALCNGSHGSMLEWRRRFFPRHFEDAGSMVRRLTRHLTVVIAALLLAGPAGAASKEQIQRAIDRGVAFLRSLQRAEGAWPTHHVGATALAGLTLLECDVPATDPAVRKAAEHVRQTSLSLLDNHGTYSISLAVLFLDRLGEPMDVPLIQALGVRLLSGQNAGGGWSYQCPALSGDDVARVKVLMTSKAELTARGSLPKPANREPSVPPELPREIRQLLIQMEQRPPAEPGALDAFLGGMGDNSNTQFAVLALWVARRHGIPAEQALARTDARFRGSQNADGGWGYRSGSPAFGLTLSTPSMTCAGLLGVGLGYGSANETRLRTDAVPKNTKTTRAAGDLGKDPCVRAALQALARVMSPSLSPAELQGLVVEGELIRTINQAREFYFLWSLERVATAYGLTAIGNRDWYAWGAGAIVGAQRPDGAWVGKYGADVDTCFALLFLRRANLVRDLTSQLKGKDFGQATLKSAGSEGDLLANAAQLTRELVQATGARQNELLNRLREHKGAAYTEALAAAIPQLSGMSKTRARDALAERLARMTAATLRDKFKDDNAEVRRAAALACTVKADKQFIPDLIALLRDRERTVARAAHAALKELSGQDFGVEAVEKWQTWREKQDRK